MNARFVQIVLSLLIVASMSSCKSMYYDSMETMGVHKRDIMKSRVENAQESQKDAKDTFKTTLELFSEVVEIKAGDLEKTYNKLNKAYEKSEARAEEVRDRIASIQSVSKALFKEWSAEIKTLENPTFRRDSEAKLRQSMDSYEKMIDAMNAAAEKMDPVLTAFRDQVIYLKHNLNAAAIASLEGEVVKIEDDVSDLIAEMEKSIAEADEFLRGWQE